MAASRRSVAGGTQRRPAPWSVVCHALAACMAVAGRAGGAPSQPSEPRPSWAPAPAAGAGGGLPTRWCGGAAATPAEKQRTADDFAAARLDEASRPGRRSRSTAEYKYLRVEHQIIFYVITGGGDAFEALTAAALDAQLAVLNKACASAAARAAMVLLSPLTSACPLCVTRVPTSTRTDPPLPDTPPLYAPAT